MSACAAPPALKKLPVLPLLGSSWPRPGVMVPFVSVHCFVRPRQLGRRRVCVHHLAQCANEMCAMQEGALRHLKTLQAALQLH